VDVPFHPPYDWERFAGFVRPRLISGLESLEETVLTRRLGDTVVRVEYRPDDGVFRIDRPNAVDRVKLFFDLCCVPRRIGIPIPPGMRVPGSWDPFEACVRAVLGQQISVKAATTFAARLCDRFGRFPTALDIATGSLERIGLTTKRTQTLRDLGVAVENGSVRLNEPNEIRKIIKINGIGAWTAEYAALRCGDPDAFPAGDLLLRRYSNSDAWRPWRSYAAMAIWTGGMTA
jgi:AraC family transcriptional regulator of adaptative response / DNA-3-methyladenine glycosylase II